MSRIEQKLRMWCCEACGLAFLSKIAQCPVCGDPRGRGTWPRPLKYAGDPT
jgi:rubrerythrin